MHTKLCTVSIDVFIKLMDMTTCMSILYCFYWNLDVALKSPSSCWSVDSDSARPCLLFKNLQKILSLLIKHGALNIDKI